MPVEPSEIADCGQKVVHLLGACAAAPDDIATARAADEALSSLEHLLAVAEEAAQAT
jgi:hypothetical protein